MKIYSDLPTRRTAQLLSDAFVVCWVGLCAWVGRVVTEAVLGMRQPADAVVAAGGSFGDNMTGAGQLLGRLPGVGDDLAKPFRSAAGNGAQFAAAGRDFGIAVDRLAPILGLVTALTPMLLVLGIWLVARVRFVRRARAAQGFVDEDADLDLFALRAMARQPMHQLARISDDPAGAWRARDPEVIRRLAELELRSSGLRPPRLTVSPPPG